MAGADAVTRILAGTWPLDSPIVTTTPDSLIGRATAAAREVAALPLDARLDLVAAGRRGLADAAAEIEDLAVREAGQARRFARREITSALNLLDALPVLADAIRPRDVPARSGRTILEWVPYGVVFGWHSANSPVWVPTLVAASAFAGGNAVLARPSRRVGGTTACVLEALTSGWPEHSVQTVALPPTQAESMIAAPGIGAVVAHASTATCRRHMLRLAQAYAAGATLRPYIPEASGNDAMVVLQGADMDAAATAAALAGFSNSGQLCMAAKRLIVERGAWQGFRPALERAVGDLVTGPADDERTDVVPMPTGAARDRSMQDLAEALAAGGQVVAGDGVRHGVLTPTVVLLPPTALGIRLWREESFAPLRALVVADDADAACILANDSPYGLGAAVFGPPGRAEQVGGALRGARVVVGEGPLYQDAHLVVGGMGDSGFSGARPKVEQLVYARRVHVAAGA